MAEKKIIICEISITKEKKTVYKYLDLSGEECFQEGREESLDRPCNRILKTVPQENKLFL